METGAKDQGAGNATVTGRRERQRERQRERERERVKWTKATREQTPRLEQKQRDRRKTTDELENGQSHNCLDAQWRGCPANTSSLRCLSRRLFPLFPLFPVLRFGSVLPRACLFLPRRAPRDQRRPSASALTRFPKQRFPALPLRRILWRISWPLRGKQASPLPAPEALDFAGSFREQTVNQTSSVNVRTRESSFNKNFCWTCWRLLSFLRFGSIFLRGFWWIAFGLIRGERETVLEFWFLILCAFYIYQKKRTLITDFGCWCRN